MNNPTREAIWSTLYARFSPLLLSQGFVTVGRRLKHWADVDKILQPYFCMAQGDELIENTRGFPSRWSLEGKLYIYARTDGDLDPGPVINPLTDAVEAALAPNPVEAEQTLGGLVSWCRLNGNVETDEGTLGPQSVVILPLTIYLGG